MKEFTVCDMCSSKIQDGKCALGIYKSVEVEETLFGFYIVVKNKKCIEMKDHKDELDDQEKIRKSAEEFSNQYGEGRLTHLLCVLMFESLFRNKIEDSQEFSLDEMLKTSAEVASYNVSAAVEIQDKE